MEQFQEIAITGSAGNFYASLSPGVKYRIDILGYFGSGSISVFGSGPSDVPDISNITSPAGFEFCTACRAVKFMLSGGTGTNLTARIAPIRYSP
jgi:hypothetical protein